MNSEKEYEPFNPDEKYRDDTLCPVCRKHYFEELGIYDECPVCGWVDDLLQRLDHNYSGGYNRISANDARKQYLTGKPIIWP